MEKDDVAGADEVDAHGDADADPDPWDGLTSVVGSTATCGVLLESKASCAATRSRSSLRFSGVT